MTAKVLFRVLSGLHEGAQIELTAGVWVVGADDSCDIILGDGLAPRHASVTVGDDGQVRIVSLDAPVLDLLGNVREGEALPAGEIVRLAEVGLAWGAPGVGADFWQGVSGTWARRGAAPQAQAGASTDSADSVDAVDSAGPASGEKPQAAEPEKAEPAEGSPVKPEAKAKPPQPRSRKISPMAIAAGIGLLAGCLAVALVPGGRSAAKKTMTSLAASSVAAASNSASTSASASASASAAAPATDGKPLTLQGLGARLKDLGLSGVSAKRLTNGTYAFTGTVADDAERALLISEAKRLDGPAVLQLEVVSDRTAPVKAAFNALDLWPEVRWEPGADGSRGTVLVSGYMATSAVEEKAFDEVSALFSQNREASDAPALERRILHREDLKALLTEALDREQLQKVGVEWLDGRIRLSSVLTAESRERLDRAIADVRSNSPVPLAIDVVNKEPPAAPESEKPAVAAAPAQAPAPEKPAFKVTAVSGGALKFVTLADGTKCFEGGEMPGGYTLEAISYNHLVLSKDKKRINFPLKVTE